MKAYCSIEDVLSVAVIFRKDVVPLIGSTDNTATYTPNTYTIPREDVEDIIIEASEMVRKILQPRYEISVIDGYDPSYPPVVVFLTKTYSAMIMLERYASQSTDRNNELISTLNRSMLAYKKIITNGLLTDVNDLVVPSLNGTVFLKETNSNDVNVKLTEIYANGRTY